MKRLLVVFVLLLTFSSSAWAEWVAVGGNDRYIFYVDPNTIRKNGSMVKMWNLFDHVNAQVDESSGKTYFSMKAQVEYDCQDERTRTLAESYHSGKMGGVDTIGSYGGPPIPVGASPARKRWRKHVEIRQREVAPLDYIKLVGKLLMSARLYTSNVPLLAFFRVSTLS